MGHGWLAVSRGGWPLLVGVVWGKSTPSPNQPQPPPPGCDILLGRQDASVLILGEPGSGKTTIIREIAALLAERRNVLIVDTSNEIGGDGDIPHPPVGDARRMQVEHPSQQHRVMIEAVENHMPEVVVIDEIGTCEETLASPPPLAWTHP